MRADFTCKNEFQCIGQQFWAQVMPILLMIQKIFKTECLFLGVQLRIMCMILISNFSEVMLMLCVYDFIE
jgi:hypothetical protein